MSQDLIRRLITTADALSEDDVADLLLEAAHALTQQEHTMLIYKYTLEIDTAPMRYVAPYTFSSRQQAADFERYIKREYAELNPKLIFSGIDHVMGPDDAIATLERELAERRRIATGGEL